MNHNAVVSEYNAVARERDALRKFAQAVEPMLSHIAFNNRPHSEEFRLLYEICVEARPLIYPKGTNPNP